MFGFTFHGLFASVFLLGKRLLKLLLLVLIIGSATISRAEGTKQLEPYGMPRSVCKLVLLQNLAEYRIPFALVGCSEEYRLNIHISDFKTEKIYLGFGDIIDYFYDTTIYHDVNYQVKYQDGTLVSASPLAAMPLPGSSGYIKTREEAEIGPDINNSGDGGYKPLVIIPLKNGDYYIEFKIPPFTNNQIRIFKYIDITVAANNIIIPGRLWSKAWQLGSGSVQAEKSASYSNFYIYTNDSIVTRFDCNGMAGGVWNIYSNEWGCSNIGSWNDRRQSIPGNASVKPQYKIFLNDPDNIAYPSGRIGKLNDFKVLGEDCDTVVSFFANVSKAGNIEVSLDLPPSNTGYIGTEDVQLTFKVNPGDNKLLPAWNGKNGHGVAVENGTPVTARIRFLNGLSNLPLYDVEDNPNGFRVDIQRPKPTGGSTKLKLFWDDTRLPAGYSPTSNIIDGCIYGSNGSASGCHAWKYSSSHSIGDTNTMNSWWYLITDDSLSNPIVLKIRPSSGKISGPVEICSGQLVEFKTTSMAFAKEYIWNLTGPGFSTSYTRKMPDSTLLEMFPSSLAPGPYKLSVFGRNPQCHDGEVVYHDILVYDYSPPPLSGSLQACTEADYQYQLSGSFKNVHWSVTNGEIIGSPDQNPVTIRWHTIGSDSVQVLSTTDECGSRKLKFQVIVNPVATVDFAIGGQNTTCPGLPVLFNDKSHVVSGKVVARDWSWGNGQVLAGNDSTALYRYPNTGNYTVKLNITTDRGCISDITKQVNIIPLPVADFSWHRNCLAQPIQLSDQSTGIDLATRRWDFGNDPVTFADSDRTQPAAVFNKTGVFPVQLFVENKYGCSDSIVKQIAIHKPPESYFVYDDPCQGIPVTFSGQSSVADTVIAGFDWLVKNGVGAVVVYSGTSVPVIFPDVDRYTVFLVCSDAFGCIDTTSQVINVKASPHSEFEFSQNGAINSGSLQFVNHSTGADLYSWDFGNGNSSTATNPGVKYDHEGLYEIILTGTNNNGCSDTATKQFYYMPGLWFPNTFSPDNNGHNDVFRPVTQRTTLDPYKLQVFDRWGRQIFSSSNPNLGWDGTFEEKPCVMGTYTYLVQYNQGPEKGSEITEQRGVVSLVR